MATFNLLRNSRVLFTTNVVSGTGIIQPTGFTTANTQELQVLDGFSFSQNSNADTVTISEAGSTPTRGQRSFNTSLANVDFSFSTYIRPRTAGGAVKAEESVLWNALLCSTPIATAAIISAATFTTVTVVAGAATLVGTGFTSGIKAGTVLVVKGVTGVGAAQYNTAIKLTADTTTTTIIGQYLVAPVAAVVLGGWTAATTFVSYAWNEYAAISTDTTAPQYAAAGVAYSSATTALSNKNQLLPFGLIVTVDGITYAIDNCALDQAVVDFGLDGIAMVAWTGKATQLRQLGAASVQATTNATTTITVTASNSGAVAVGQTVSGSGIPAATTVASLGTYTPGTGIGTVILSQAATLTQATSVTLLFGVGTNTAANVVYSAVQDPVLSGPIAGTATGKITTANYITNKLSTVTMIKNIGGLGAGNTTYTLALTGGSITIANNINYVTPANLGVVNIPIGYYTGTRAISGSLNAYLRTGSTNSAGLLADLLAASATAAGIEPKFRLQIEIGGNTAQTRVEVEMAGANLQIPTIDAQAVMSTAINFTAQGSDAAQGPTANYDIENTNDLNIRYLSL